MMVEEMNITGRNTFNISDLATGVYTIKISTDKGTVSKLFIKK